MALLMLCVASPAAHYTPRVLRDGWVKSAPTWVLIAVTDGKFEELRELEARIGSGRYPTWGRRTAALHLLRRSRHVSDDIFASRLMLLAFELLRDTAPLPQSELEWLCRVAYGESGSLETAAVSLLAGYSGDDAESVMVLRRAMSNGSAANTQVFACWVGLQGEAAAPLVPDLLKVLDSSTSGLAEAMARLAAIRSLGRIGPSAIEAVEPLRRIRNEARRDATERYVATEALLLIERKVATPQEAATQLLSDPELVFRVRALEMVVATEEDPLPRLVEAIAQEPAARKLMWFRLRHAVEARPSEAARASRLASTISAEAGALVESMTKWTFGEASEYFRSCGVHQLQPDYSWPH